MIKIRSGPGAKQCVAVLNYSGRLPAELLPSFVGLLLSGVDIAIETGQAHVDRARSRLATQLIDHDGYERILWVDDDVLFSVDQALSLLAHPADLIGGVYARRRSEGRALACELEPDAAPDAQGVLRARWCGTGFLATSAELYRRIRAVHGFEEAGGIVPYFIPLLLQDGCFASEDIAFCVRALVAGVPCYVASRVRLIHRETVDTAPLVGATAGGANASVGG